MAECGIFGPNIVGIGDRDVSGPDKFRGDADQELYAIFFLFPFVFLSLLSFLYISIYLPGVYFLNTCHHTFHFKV